MTIADVCKKKLRIPPKARPWVVDRLTELEGRGVKFDYTAISEYGSSFGSERTLTMPAEYTGIPLVAVVVICAGFSHRVRGKYVVLVMHEPDKSYDHIYWARSDGRSLFDKDRLVERAMHIREEL